MYQLLLHTFTERLSNLHRDTWMQSLKLEIKNFKLKPWIKFPDSNYSFVNNQYYCFTSCPSIFICDYVNKTYVVLDIGRHVEFDFDKIIVKTFHAMPTNVYLIRSPDLYTYGGSISNSISLEEKFTITLLGMSIESDILKSTFTLDFHHPADPNLPARRIFGRCSIFDNSFVHDNIYYLQLSIGTTNTDAKNHVYIFQLNDGKITFLSKNIMDDRLIIIVNNQIHTALV